MIFQSFLGNLVCICTTPQVMCSHMHTEPRGTRQRSNSQLRRTSTNFVIFDCRLELINQNQNRKADRLSRSGLGIQRLGF